MKRFLSAIASLLGQLLAVPADKAGHFGVGVTVGLSSLWLGVWAMMPVVIVAIAKEVWDAAHPATHKVDLWDALAVILGGAVSILVILFKFQHP